jgi:hypothetical protein
MTAQDLEKLYELLIKFKTKQYECDHECRFCKYQTQDLACAILELTDDVAEYFTQSI